MLFRHVIFFIIYKSQQTNKKITELLVGNATNIIKICLINVIVRVHKFRELPISKLFLVRCGWKHCLYVGIQASRQRAPLSSPDVWEEPEYHKSVGTKPFLRVFSMSSAIEHVFYNIIKSLIVPNRDNVLRNIL